ncbi:MAG: DUF3426 domain-containing protein [bacterium]
MIVICDKCNTKYKLDDTLLTEDGVKVRCSKCGNTFIVKKPKPEDIQRIEQSQSKLDNSQPESGIHSALDKAISETISNITTEEPKNIDAGSEFDWSALNEEKEPTSKAESAPLPEFEWKPENQQPQASIEIGKDHNAQLEEISKYSQATVDNTHSSTLTYEEPKITAPTIEHAVKESIKQSRSNYLSGTLLPVVKKVAIIIFVLIILGAGAYWGYVYRSQITQISSNILINLSRYIGSNKQINIGVAISDSRGYFLKNIRGQQLFVIEGKVTNITDHPISFIKLSADIADNNNNVIATKTFYAGNMLTDEELRTYTSDKINSILNNEMGQSLKNFNVPPKSSLQFMVVFFDVPDNLSSFTVLPKSAHQGVQ